MIPTLPAVALLLSQIAVSQDSIFPGYTWESPGNGIYVHTRVEPLRPELPTLELVYPDTVFDDELVIGSPARPVHLRWVGRGNTDGDVVAWLPQDKLLVTGDLLVAPIPFAFDSPMRDWSVTLGRLASFGAATIIPGHGPVQRGDAYLDRVRALLDATLDAVRRAHASGVAYPGLADAVDLDSYRLEFAGDDAQLGWAWRSYFLAPGLKSAWASLGYALPDGE